jgi:hypothetical protein
MPPSATVARPDRAIVLADLLANRQWSGTPAESWVPRAQAALAEGTMPVEHVNWSIRHLAELERRAYEPIPDGRYMVGLQRFRCTTATEGKWAGWTTVVELSERGAEALLKKDDRKHALALIRGVGTTLAAARYGQKTGKCGYCHLSLSDPRSVAAGYGEKCATDRGLPW